MAQFEFKLPELGEGIHEGEIVKWHIEPGDTVEEDQIIVEVQNDKAVVEVPSPVNGTVKEVVVEEGTVSVVGDTLVTFDVEGDIPDSLKGDNEDSANEGPQAIHEEKSSDEAKDKSKDSDEAKDKVDTQKKESSPPEPNRKILATPSIRKFAREEGVDISQVTATGPNGRITREDVKAFASGEQVQKDQSSAQESDQVPSKAVSKGERHEERVPLKGIRKAIANAMTKSVYTAPHVTVMDEVDCTKLVELRSQAKPLAEKKGIKLTYLPFIVKAMVAGLREYPALNASVDEKKEEIVYKYYYNVGIATDTDNGLIVPVIDDADRKSMWQIAEAITDLATRGRDGKLSSDELKGSTMTITNIGSAGGMFFTPVINYPEVAILGSGIIKEKPVVKDGEVTIAPVMALSLSFDHRIIDGVTAQQYVNYVKMLLEDPQLLILEV